MFTLYTKTEMIARFALVFERTQTDFSPSADCYTLPEWGECQLAYLPIRFIGDKRLDCVVGFIPTGQSEPLYYAFLSEMQAE